MTKAAHPGARASRPHPFPWVAAQFPCDGAPVHPAGGNRMGPAQAEPGRLCRSIRVEEMGEALPVLCGRDARAPGCASSHDVVISRSRYPRCIRARLVIEGGPSLFVFIRVHWWFVSKNDRQFLPRIDPAGRAGAGLIGCGGCKGFRWTAFRGAGLVARGCYAFIRVFPGSNTGAAATVTGYALFMYSTCSLVPGTACSVGR